MQVRREKFYIRRFKSIPWDLHQTEDITFESMRLLSFIVDSNWDKAQ